MIDNGQKNGWFDSEYITKLGITSLIAFILFIWRQLRAKNPLLDLSIIKNWNFTFGAIILTTGFAIGYGTIAMLPQFLQRLLGYDSYLSGLAAGPMGFGSILGVISAGILAKKIDLRIQSFIGLSVFSIGCFIFSSLNLDISFTNVVAPNIILGFGMTMIMVPTTTIIFSNVSKEEMTNASSVQNLIKNIGCAAGTSSVGVLVSRYSQIHQSHLVDRLTPLNSMYIEKLSALIGQFMSLGHDSITSAKMAQAMIYNQLFEQSTLCAFMSSYKLYSFTILIVLPVVFVLKRVCYDKK